MSFNEDIYLKIEEIIKFWDNTQSKKMFGGICNLLNGNMFCGVYKDFLILRLGKDKADELLTHDHFYPFDITGKPMKGWVMVDMDGFETNEKLLELLQLAKDFVTTLPAK